MKKIIFFSLALMAWARVSAQIKLTGTVLDAQSNQPIPGVVLQLKNFSPLETDSGGKFLFTLTDTGTYQLKFIMFGYENQTIEVAVPNTNPKQIEVKLVPGITELEPVEVNAIRANSNTPMAYENLNKEEIEVLNTGRDVPYLLEQMPSVITTSDAGAGIGYTNMRVRGSDISRINVTVNGIPMNDAESHGVYWVNMPDLASSTNSIQLQRGVGTSTNGSSAFGASLNMETNGPTAKPMGMIHVGGGSFNTQRYTAQFGSGLINKNWWMSGRLSKLKTDGYVDRASSDLQSYFVTGGFVNEKTAVRAVVFGGKEKTYQSWNGVDSATFASDPTYNSAGAIYHPDGSVTYYDNETDNYQQTHYQLHVNQKLSKLFKLNVSGHYTKGQGYYEQYKQDGDMAYYGMYPIIMGNDTITTTDLVRRKWLDNDFYGAIFNIEYENEKWQSIFGGGVHNYEGNHFGQVIWARYASQTENDHEYYNSFSTKFEWNVYWKNMYAINKKIMAFVDLQVRSVDYSAHGVDDDVAAFSYDQKNIFFNPKIGATYVLNANSKLFASYAVANKEPNRTDLIYADPDDLPKPETLQDIELGFDWSKENFTLKANAFYMHYTNQLVLTGKLDAVGYPIRKNVGKSYRSGVELSAIVAHKKWLKWSPNVAYIVSQNVDYLVEGGNGEFVNIGNTAIAYSPNVVAGSFLEFVPIKNLSAGIFSKYVSRQYLNNSEEESLSIADYFINDLRFSYLYNPSWIGSVRVYFNINNVFDVSYASNGADYGVAYYYPQAGINFLTGIQINLQAKGPR